MKTISMFVLAIVYTFMGAFCQGQHLEFSLFVKTSWKESVYKSDSITKCNIIPRDVDQERMWISNIISDSCHMFYLDDNCKSFYKEKVLAGVSRWSGSMFEDFGSFHVCNHEAGGDQLNFAIKEDTGIESPLVIYSFRDVCSCINMPSGMDTIESWTIDNYGNKLFAYYEYYCKGKPYVIGTDNKKQSYTRAKFWHIQEEKMAGSIVGVKSYGPDPDSDYFKKSCNAHQMSVKALARLDEMDKKLEQLNRRE